jgi:hypothetical protein
MIYSEKKPHRWWTITKHVLAFSAQLALIALMWASRIVGTILLKISLLAERILEYEEHDSH